MYRVNPVRQIPTIRLEVTETATGRIVERQLQVRAEEELWLACRFAKLELTKKEVRIRTRKGDRAEVFLKRNMRPRLMVFALAELFAKE
ncbi:MAG: hypothetical protein P8K08_23525 [Fuerstiella sp.]|nr:hypothetical protein [Fuerstiella sp.]